MCVKTTKNYFAAYTRQKQPTFHLLSALSPKIIIDLGGQNWLQSENITKLMTIVNKELLKAKSWLEINKLALNIEKTDFVAFSSSRMKLIMISKLDLAKNQ